MVNLGGFKIGKAFGRMGAEPLTNISFSPQNAIQVIACQLVNDLINISSVCIPLLQLCVGNRRQRLSQEFDALANAVLICY